MHEEERRRRKTKVDRMVEVMHNRLSALEALQVGVEGLTQIALALKLRKPSPRTCREVIKELAIKELEDKLKAEEDKGTIQ